MPLNMPQTIVFHYCVSKIVTGYQRNKMKLVDTFVTENCRIYACWSFDAKKQSRHNHLDRLIPLLKVGLNYLNYLDFK